MRSSDDPTSAARVYADLVMLADLDRATLSSRWTALTGAVAPKRSTSKLLALALAYEMQLRLSKEMQDAENAVNRTLARSSAPERRSAPRRLAPGARILREWRGQTLIVDIIKGGFLFEGERYASLSAIARKATGVARNGPAFFGLRDRGGA